MRQTFQQAADEFNARDLYLASVLNQAGIPILQIEDSNGRGVFVFQGSNEIERLSRDYFNGTLRVDPQGLFAAWKALKSATYSAIRDVR
ncbi:MAG: hypothetical protein HY886_07535 [Deltaproteobacteria bacterium]|nr:hypothetical protein [Deltaproteobacteria bacterium]